MKKEKTGGRLGEKSEQAGRQDLQRVPDDLSAKESIEVLKGTVWTTATVETGKGSRNLEWTTFSKRFDCKPRWF